MKRLEYLVAGMTGPASVKALEAALAQVAGVESCSVQIGRVTILVHPAKAGPDEVETAIEEAGFKVAGPADEPRRLEGIFGGG